MIQQTYPLRNWNCRVFKNAQIIYIGDIIYLKSNEKILAKKVQGKVIMGVEFNMNKTTMKHLSVFMGIDNLCLKNFVELVNIGHINMDLLDLRQELKGEKND